MKHEGLCEKCRDKWGPYIMVLNGPELPAAHEVNGNLPPAGWLTMRQAAERLGFSYFWLSRNWKQLGLHPSSPRPGRRAKRMFEVKEIDQFMSDHKYTRRGRPRKTKGLHA